MKKLVLVSLMVIGLGFGQGVKAEQVDLLEENQIKTETIEKEDPLNNKYVGTSDVHAIEVEYNNKKWILLQDDFDLFFFVPENVAKEFKFEDGKDYNVSYLKSNDVIFYSSEISNKNWESTEMWTNEEFLNETMEVLEKNETSYELQISTKLKSELI